jgi:hypothetical protein
MLSMFIQVQCAYFAAWRDKGSKAAVAGMTTERPECGNPQQEIQQIAPA